MTTALAKVQPDPPPQSFAEVQAMANLFVESRLFPDIKSVAVAAVKIMAGRELGFGPFASMSGIHVVQGKAEPGANLIATLVKRSGRYDYRVAKIANDECSIEFFEDGKLSGTSTFTAEDARRAGTKNMTAYPRNMLFARAMSNGVKWFCPDVENGVAVYSQGEIGELPATVNDEQTVDAPAAEPSPLPVASKPPTGAVSNPAPLDLIHKLHTVWLSRKGWKRVMGYYQLNFPPAFPEPKTDDDLAAMQTWLTADAAKYLHDAWEETSRAARAVADAKRAEIGKPSLKPGDENSDPEPALAGDASEV